MKVDEALKWYAEKAEAAARYNAKANGNAIEALFVELSLDAGNRAKAALASDEHKSWECAASKQGTAGGNDPADCNWPFCGCDPYANKVTTAIEESGFPVGCKCLTATAEPGEGWKMVPFQMTPAMKDAAREGHMGGVGDVSDMWEAAYLAAPGASVSPSSADASLAHDITTYLESRPGNSHADKLLRRAVEALGRVSAEEQPADFLWSLLDDIDTASDRAKADDAAYRAIVERIQRRRFEVGSTDGYSVTFRPRTDSTEGATKASTEDLSQQAIDAPDGEVR